MINISSAAGPTGSASADPWSPSRVRATLVAFGRWIAVDRRGALAAGATAAAFVLLFGEAFLALAQAWWNDPDAGHGLLLFPIAIWLVLADGLLPSRQAQHGVGAALIIAAVVVRVGAGTAAGLTLARLSLVLAVLGLIVYYAGLRQVGRWWLPLAVFVLSIPLPFYIVGEIASPLQIRASQLGAALLRLRDVPVLLTGNVIRLPGHDLFVTEACSGLRSLTSLVSMAVLMGGLMLRSAWWRLALVGSAVVVAVLVNGVRVFLTGFLVLFVDPAMGEGFMHLSEGMLLFGVSMAILFGTASLAAWAETRRLRSLPHNPRSSDGVTHA